MVCIGDDIEAYLIVEGREVWRVTGRKISVLQCPACGVMGEREIEPDTAPDPEPTECGDCGATVTLVYRDAWRCSECGDAETNHYDFLRHIGDEHNPTL